MKNSVKLILVTVGTALALSFNTSCTPTEAAIVGGIAGAAIGAAAASDNRGHRGHRGHGHGNHGNHGGWNNGW